MRMKKKLRVLGKTRSLCPKCFQVVDAEIMIKNNKVLMIKRCKKHGVFKGVHVWNKPFIYRTMQKIAENTSSVIPEGLVLNITFNCNQHCPFCYMRANENNFELSMNDIKTRLANFKGGTIYLSGGEPTVHPKLFKILQFLKDEGYRVIIFSNGKKFDDEFVSKMKGKVGLVILSFDSAKSEKVYEYFCSEKLLDFKLRAIKNLQKYKIPMYLLVKCSSINFKEIPELIQFALNTDFVEFIGFQPIWELGRLKKHKRFYTSDILKGVTKSLKISQKEFLKNTEKIHHIEHVLHDTNYVSACELKCHLFFDDNEWVPLTKINLSNFIYLLKSLIQKRMKKVYIGTFPIADNIDLQFSKTCNLNSDYPHGTEITPACIRQILMDGKHGRP